MGLDKYAIINPAVMGATFCQNFLKNADALPVTMLNTNKNPNTMIIVDTKTVKTAFLFIENRSFIEISFLGNHTNIISLYIINKKTLQVKRYSVVSIEKLQILCYYSTVIYGLLEVTMFSVTERAYAKINLYLDITGKREDGFHDILTIMQIVSLYDEVDINLNLTDELTVTVVNSDVNISQEKNIAYIAAKKFYEHLYFTPKGKANIYIKKRIPIAAGLAGGSADAAAVLRGLNYLYGKPFTRQELCKIGMEVGSDVPFCIIGGTQVCRNRGDVTFDMYGIQNYYLLIACAGEKDSTADQYKKLDKKYNDFKDYVCGKNYGDLFGAFSVGKCREAFPLMFNIFESLYENDKDIDRIKAIMKSYEAKVTMISGSGPAVFGVFPDRYYAEDAQEELAKEGIASYLCRPINLEYDVMLPNKEPWL